MTLLHEKVRTLNKTNQILTKRWRTKKTRIRVRGTFTVENVHNLIEQKEIVRQQLSRRSMKETITQTRSSGLRHCERCDKTNHNVRTCPEIEDTSEKDNDIENNWFSCVVTAYDS